MDLEAKAKEAIEKIESKVNNWRFTGVPGSPRRMEILSKIVLSALQEAVKEKDELLSRAFTVMGNHKVEGISRKQQIEEYGRVYQEIGEVTSRTGKAKSLATESRPPKEINR